MASEQDIFPAGLTGIDEMAEALSDPLWRLSNLYQIVTKAADDPDEAGKPVVFKMNPMQMDLYKTMRKRNLILKARQHGYSTFLLLRALDLALFNNNFHVGVIAHTIQDAKDLFEKKILFPYENLPEAIRVMIPSKRDRDGELSFANGSSVRVSASFRSGTLDWLHVSEMGKIAARFPQKAVEILTGAIEAVPINGSVHIESTAEGRGGLFFDMAMASMRIQQEGRKPEPLEYQFHFAPWFVNDEYRLKATKPLTERMAKYFHELEASAGVILDAEQKAWYAAKEELLGEMMLREYPSTPEEAFKASVLGAYFSKQIADARKQGRITSVPILPEEPVETWWDIGRDTTAIWFTQNNGLYCNVIDFYQNSGEGLAHYRDVLRERAETHGIKYLQHHYPHDMANIDWKDDRTRLSRARDLGIDGEAHDRMQHKEDGIESARSFFAHCVFDSVRCDEGLKGLESYRKRWDEVNAVWRDEPLHDWASHPADAFQLLAMNHRFALQTGRQPVIRQRRSPRKIARAGY